MHRLSFVIAHSQFLPHVFWISCPRCVFVFVSEAEISIYSLHDPGGSEQKQAQTVQKEFPMESMVTTQTFIDMLQTKVWCCQRDWKQCSATFS